MEQETRSQKDWLLIVSYLAWIELIAYWLSFTFQEMLTFKWHWSEGLMWPILIYGGILSIPSVGVIILTAIFRFKNKPWQSAILILPILLAVVYIILK